MNIVSKCNRQDYKKKKNYKKFEMIARKKKMNIWKYMIFPSLEKIHEDI